MDYTMWFSGSCERDVSLDVSCVVYMWKNCTSFILFLHSLVHGVLCFCFFSTFHSFNLPSHFRKKNNFVSNEFWVKRKMC